MNLGLLAERDHGHLLQAEYQGVELGNLQVVAFEEFLKGLLLALELVILLGGLVACVSQVKYIV